MLGDMGGIDDHEAVQGEAISTKEQLWDEIYGSLVKNNEAKGH